MHVLQDKRKALFTAVVASRLRHRAGRRICPKCFVVSAAIVVTGEAKTAGCPENDESRRKRQPQRPPGRARSEPAVLRLAKNLRRIERRQVWPPVVVVTLKRCPGGVNNESRKHTKNR